MQAGLLRDKITIQRVATSPASPYGGDVEQWEDYRAIRARKVIRSGGVGVNAMEMHLSEVAQFEVHLYQDVRRTDRIKHDDDTYRVVGLDKNLRTRRLTITAERVNE